MNLIMPDNLSLLDRSRIRMLRKFFISSTILSGPLLIISAYYCLSVSFRALTSPDNTYFTFFIGSLFIFLMSLAGIFLVPKKSKLFRWSIPVIFFIWFLIQFRISPFIIGIALMLSSVFVSPSASFFISIVYTVEVMGLFALQSRPFDLLVIINNAIPFIFTCIIYSLTSMTISRELYKGFLLFEKQNGQLRDARARVALIVADQDRQIRKTENEIQDTRKTVETLTQKLTDMNSSLMRLREVSRESKKITENI